MNIGIVLLVDDALELVVGQGRSNRAGVCECCCGHHAVGYDYTGEHILLVALGDIECELQLRLHHVGVVLIHYRDGECAAIIVRHGGIVASYFLALEGIGCRGGFLAVVAQVGCNGHFGVLNEEFLGDTSGNGSRHAVTHHLQGVGIHRKVIGLELAELLAATRQEQKP